jgi:hypothetical protein
MEREIEQKYLHAEGLQVQIPIGGAGQIEAFGPFCAVGDTRITRTGEKMTLTSLSMRFQIDLTAIEAVGCSVRLIIGYDRRPQGASPAVTNIIASDSIVAGYQTTQNSTGRFQIIGDKTITFDASQTQYADKIFFNKKYRTLYRLGNAGTVADINEGTYFILALAANNASAINVNYGFQFRLNDM